MIASVALIAIGLVGAASSAALPKKTLSLPSYVKTCRRDQPETNSCILSSLKKLQPYLVKGIPELDLPPFDPYFIDELNVEYVNGHVEGRMALKDFTTYGMTGLQFLTVRSNFSDLDNINLQIDVFIPKMKSEGKYKVQGRFLGAEMGSRGSFQISTSNVTATWDIIGGLRSIDGDNYLKIKQFYVNPEVQDMKVYASNLFNGNEPLTNAVLSLINQNWRPVYEELLPYSREGWDKVFRELANRVFLRVPFERIFPGSP